MRIGLVVTGGVDRSGRERVVPTLLWLVERLARYHDLHVFALHYYREPSTYPLLGATVHDLGQVEGWHGRRRARQRARLWAALSRCGPFDVLHAYLGLPSMVMAPVARRLGVPAILSLSSGEFVSLDDIGYGLQRRWRDRRSIASAIRSAARITVDTTFMADLAAAHGIQPLILPLGIDPDCFPLAHRTDGPPWRLLRVASLNRVKDYPTLVRALAILVKRELDVHLDIVGEDTMNGAIQTLARSLALETRVTFHGFQPTEQLAGFYARAHLHVSSSRHEGAGVVMLEAAVTGLASVGTAVGYLADWSLAPSPRGVGVPAQSPDALANGIAQLLSDPSRRMQIATAAREWTVHHDANWTAQQFERVYAEAAGSK